MRRGDPLNTKQCQILKWIAEGCPPDQVEGYGYKTTAMALHHRRLVVVSRKAGTWKAVVAPDGEFYLTHGHMPLDPVSKRTADLSPVQQAKALLRDSPSSLNETGSNVDGGQEAARSPAEPAPGPTRAFVDRLVAMGGEMALDSWSPERHLVLAANRYRMAPEGTHLIMGQRLGQSAVWLERLPEALTGPIERVPVPGTLRAPYEAVVALRERDSCLPAVGHARKRALLLLQALIGALERRGCTVTANGILGRAFRRSSDEAPGVITVVHARHQIGVGLEQLKDRSAHVPTVKEAEQFKHYGYPRIPKWDHTPNERLSLTINGGSPQQKSKWSEGPRQSLDDLLGEVVRELELRFAAFEEAHREREREAERRKVRWEAAMVQARTAFKQAALELTLQDHAKQWKRVQQITAYMDAMTRHAEQLSGEARREAYEWLDFAKAHRDQLDPLRRPLKLPVVPEPTTHDLAPFLPPGMSPWNH